MFITPIYKNVYTKFFNKKDNSLYKIKEKNISENPKENKTFWETIQKLKPLVK